MKAVLFSAVMLVVVGIFFYLSMVGKTRVIIADLTDSAGFISTDFGSDEIERHIAKVRTQDGTTKLIIGDSVCNQMFGGMQEYNDDFTIAGSNGAITMAGQYILAKEYIDNHPDATDIYLIVLPDSFERTFDTTWGYQYTAMPFVETGTLKELDEDTIQIMESVYGSFFMRPSIVHAVHLSGMSQKIYLNMLRKRTAGYTLNDFYELADRYVYKIYEMCRERGIVFHLYSCPVADTRMDEIRNLDSSYGESSIYEINPDFYQSIYFFPAEEAEDGAHFSGDYANQEHYNETIKQMFKGNELVEMLNFEEQ